MSERTMRVGFGSHGGASTYLSVAIEAGYFRDVGIEVQMIKYPNTMGSISSVLAGATDIASGAGVHALMAARAGQDPLVVLSNASINLFSVIGARDVTSPEQLRGRSVAVNEMGDQDALILFRALLDWGLVPDVDVTVATTHGRRASWEGLIEGRYAAMAATVPEPALARRRGLPILRDFSTKQEPYQLGCMVTTRRFADEQPEVLRRFLSAACRGLERFETDVGFAIQMLRARLDINDEAVLAETHAVFTNPANDHVPRVEALTAVARDLVAVRGEEWNRDLSAYVDASFV